jgi:ketol-acid reductoisomerase
VAEDDAGRPVYTKLAEEGAHHPVEEVGARLRALMSWIEKD